MKPDSKSSAISFRIDWQACIRCGACVAVCPLPAGFTTPFDTIAVEHPCGVACLACQKICPVSAIESYPAGTKEIKQYGIAALPHLQDSAEQSQIDD